MDKGVRTVAAVSGTGSILAAKMLLQPVLGTRQIGDNRVIAQLSCGTSSLRKRLFARLPFQPLNHSCLKQVLQMADPCLLFDRPTLQRSAVQALPVHSS